MRRAGPVLVVCLVVLVAACSAGANPEVGTVPAVIDHPAGFWLGLWHGLIAPVAFVISLFRDSVNVYEVHNSGNWYDAGFVLGLSMIFGGPFAGRRRR